MPRYQPTLKQIIDHIIISIATHPAIEDPGIYYPTPIDEQASSQPQLVKITEFRNYGGPVLEQPGLVCSVYPYYTPRDAMTDSPSPWAKQTVHYEPYTLGRPGEGATDDALYRLVIELSYQDAGLNTQGRLFYSKVKSSSLQPKGLHAYKVVLKDSDNSIFDEQLREHNPDALIEKGFIDIGASPGEDLLRLWVDHMRQVVTNLQVLLPFTVRNLRVDDIDFPTSHWSKSGNIYFHQAYLTCTLNIYVQN